MTLFLDCLMGQKNAFVGTRSCKEESDTTLEEIGRGLNPKQFDIITQLLNDERRNEVQTDPQLSIPRQIHA